MRRLIPLLLLILSTLPICAQLPSSGVNAGGLQSGAVMQGIVGGGTQCVQVNNSGVPSGTGAACGSGSGGNPIAGTKAQPYVAPSTGSSVIPVNTPLYLDALQLGATPDVAINLCTIGAFCDARSFGPASYTTTSQITVGNTSGGAETLMLPTGGLRPSSLGSWTSNATGGTSTTLFQYGGSTITGTPNSGLGNQFRLRAGTGSALSHIYQTAAGANGENYFYACCMTVENISGTGGAVTSGNAGSLISGSADASVWEYMGFFDALDTYDLELANNCCGPTIRSSQINANYGGTPLHVITGAGQGGGPYNLNEVSIVHPGSGVYALLQSDTSPHSTILNLNNVYTETSTTNCTFGIFSISGAKSVNIHNWDAQANCSGMSSPGITIANVGTTGAHFDGLTFANGTGDWFYPVSSAIVDSYRGVTIPSDVNGHIGMYDNSVTWSWLNGTTGHNIKYEQTIASASTIAPTKAVVLLTGTTQVNTITPATGCTTTGLDCEQQFVIDPATGPAPFGTSGNIYAAATPQIGSTFSLVYRPATSKWYSPGSPNGGSAGSTGQPQVKSSAGGFTFAPDIWADAQAGADCGAQVNAALTILGSNPGNVIVSSKCAAGTGTWSTAVTLGANQHLFMKPGFFTVSATITVGTDSSIECDSNSDADTDNGSCDIFQASSSNLSSIINITGDYGSLVHLTVDGNKANNTTAGPNILISGIRSTLFHVNSFASHSHGISIGGTTGSANNASVGKFSHVFVNANGGDGIFCQYSSDLFVGDQSEIQNNTGNGVELKNCSGSRIVYNDISGNSYGVYIWGVNAGGLANYNTHVSLNTFSTQFKHDIFIQGYDTATSSVVSQYNELTGNIFQSSANHGNGVYDGIKIQDSAGNAVTGNVCMDFNSSTHYNACIEFANVASTEATDTATGNVLTTSGTPMIVTNTTNQYGNVFNEVPNIDNRIEYTVASAATVAVQSQMVKFTGTTQVNTITVPTGTSSGCFKFFTASSLVFGTSGNILTGLTSAANAMHEACYWASESKWIIQ